ncbi:MAG: alpha/beta fold hydrolase [Gammaproteobacteria bacterium]|nr:MAG: alpha/beta fold hydrolase [Gammaproteobacteria bacterium]
MVLFNQKGCRFMTQELIAEDGHRIPLYVWAPPEETPVRCVVQITHGMAEHAGRYTRFARFLNSHGAVVVAHDHRGHGRTLRTMTPGHYGDRNGWQAVCQDLFQVHQHICETWPDRPRFLFAHSMGSFIAQAAIMAHPFSLEGLALSGSNREALPRILGALQIARLERWRQGRRGKSALIYHLSFGAFNQRFRPARTDHDWLSSDPDEVDRYLKDPLCGFRCTNETWVQLLKGLSKLFARSGLDAMPRDLPVLILSGDQDPVGRYGQGPRKLARDLQQAPCGPVTCAFYPAGRHELVNESFRDRVMQDVASWLSGLLPETSAPEAQMRYTVALD